MSALWPTFLPIIAVLAGIFLFACYVQHRLSGFMDFANRHRALLGLRARVPDWYFPFSIRVVGYGFALYLYRTRALPEAVAARFPDYPALRRLGCAVLWLDIGLGVVVLTGLVVHQILLRG